MDKGNIRHSLHEILFLTFSAALSGFTEWGEIHEFGIYKIKWLRSFYPYRFGIPSHDTLGRFFARLDPNAFCECFTEWMAEIREHLENEVIALDGKSMNGVNPSAKGMESVYYVSAFASKAGLVLSQKATARKSNEIKVIPKLLDMIDCRGSIITADALNCQLEIAEKIIEKKADYLLALKKNQGEIYQQTIERFEKQSPDSVNINNDIGHGRIEKRTCRVLSDLRFIDNASYWPQLRSVVKIQAERIIKKTGETQTETRYYLSSLNPDAELINKSVRRHWSIENQLHWHLDVNFNEDKSRKRKDHSAENFTIVLKTALNLLKQRKEKRSMKIMKMKALMLDNERENLIFGL